MAGFVAKLRAVMKHPPMLQAYVRWCCARALAGHSPRLPVAPGVRIGHWLNFSEFWSFQNGLPKPERAFLWACFSTGRGIAVDVGANIGLFTCALAAAGAGCVIAFEPIAETFCRLKQNVLENGFAERCVLNCFGIGRRTELVTFSVRTESPATNRWCSQLSSRLPTVACEARTVALASLDDYCAAEGISHIKFLKIDVEGMEPFVLKGAERLLKEARVDRVLIEVCPGNLKSAGSTPDQLFAAIQEVGYRPLRVLGCDQKSQELTKADFERIALENIALVPR